MPGQISSKRRSSPFAKETRVKIPRTGRGSALSLQNRDTAQLLSNLDLMPGRYEPWLRYPEAAKEIGVTRGTLEVWLSTKRYAVPHYKVGRSVLFKRSELLVWLDSRRQGGDAGLGVR